MRILRRIWELAVAGKFTAHVQKTHGTWGNAAFSAFSRRHHSRKEFLFSQVYPHLPIAPTYFTLYGLVNIQRRCKKLDRGHVLWYCFESQFAVDLRTRSDCRVQNYGILGGRLVCLDYANEKTQMFLIGEGGSALERVNGTGLPQVYATALESA